MSEQSMAELARHNAKLAMTAQSLRLKHGRAVAVVRRAVENAVPISGQNEDHPSEYVVPADMIGSLRDLISGSGKSCWICGSNGGGCNQCGGNHD